MKYTSSIILGSLDSNKQMNLDYKLYGNSKAKSRRVRYKLVEE